MPEGYVHAQIAQAAAAAVGWQIHCLPAYLAGANGPDMFYCFEVWKKRASRRMDLPGFGNTLHSQRTGAWLRALHRHAITPAQRDYFMGFLAHYTADCTVHPFVSAVMEPGQPYAMPGGHGYFEIALDSSVRKKLKGSGRIPVDEISPPIPGEALPQVCSQIRRAAAEVYGLDIPAQFIAEAFDHNHFLRGVFQTHTGLRYGLFWLVEPLFGGRGFITGHVSPRTLAGEGKRDAKKGIALPCPWVDPYTGVQHPEDIWQLLRRAENNTQTAFLRLLEAGGMTPGVAGQLPQAGEELEAFWAWLGSCDYVAGKETPASAQGAAAWPVAPR